MIHELVHDWPRDEVMLLALFSREIFSDTVPPLRDIKLSSIDNLASSRRFAQNVGEQSTAFMIDLSEEDPTRVLLLLIET